MRGGGIINGIKEKGRWKVEVSELERFKKANDRKLAKIRAEYIDLWRQGLDWQKLKDRTREDFEKRGILYGDIEGFAEWTIYNHVMQDIKAEKEKGVKS